MSIWQVVVHGAYDATKVIGFQELATHFLITEHPADDDIPRTHTHVMLDGVKVTDEAIRKRIKKFGLGGRGNYAIFQRCAKQQSAYDRDKLGTYMLKGKKDYLKQSSYEDSMIDLWVESWVAHNIPDEVSDNKKQEKPKKDKVKSHYEIMQEILAVTRLKNGIWSQDNTITTDDNGLIVEPVWKCHNRSFVFNTMLQYLAKYQIRTSKHELERWFVTLMRDEKDTREALYSSIMKKIYSDA